MTSVESIHFSVWSPEDIRQQSVVEITEAVIYKKNVLVRQGLRDPRLGLTSRKGVCETCGMNWAKCPGHFGHVELPCPVFHPGWTRKVAQMCSITCRHCHYMCDPNIVKKPKQCPECSKPMVHVTYVNPVTLRTPSGKLTPQQVLEWLQPITDTKGLDYHPSHLIIQALPIPPNAVRPSPTVNDEAIRSEDPLTKKMIGIMRMVKQYRRYMSIENTPDKIFRACAAKVQDAVLLYIDHTKSKAYKNTDDTSIAGRFRGKGGRVRGNMMGKRVNFSARSVISGDAALGMKELGVPHEIADTLTVPVNINRYNIDAMQELVNKNKAHNVTQGGRRIDLRYTKRRITLRINDVVERVLQDGDIVLFNRQPSLHKMSIMAHRVVRTRGKTFRLNLSCTTPYNADFDGDEMNMHVPQTLEAQVEARELVSVEKNILTPQSHKPVMGIVQDALLGAFLMTDPKVRISRERMMQLCMVGNCNLPEMPKGGNGTYTGLQAISMLLPDDCAWSKHIWGGEMISGRANKKMLGRSDGSLIHVLYNDYGPDRCVEFMNAIQRVTIEWMRLKGFSLGIQEMVQPEETRQKIAEAYEIIVKQVDDVFQAYRKEVNPNKKAFESKVNTMLNQARDTMGKIARETIEPGNRLLEMVSSGAKGSLVNVLQIMACVGQQNCQGKRIEPTLGGRVLPMFEPHDDRAAPRGFVRNSYMDGLNSAEFFMHGTGGREGMIDTAVKTATSGYIQRRLVKSLEALTTHWDGTVRDQHQRVYQFKYGDDGYDGIICEMVEWPKHEARDPKVCESALST